MTKINIELYYYINTKIILYENFWKNRIIKILRENKNKLKHNKANFFNFQN